MQTVRIPSGRSFLADTGESLLDAALRNGITLPYSCKTGRCNTCKARVTGSTATLRDEIGLSVDERARGWILTCSRSAESNLDLDIEDLGDVQLFPARTYPCRIQALQRLAPTVLCVTLRLPPSSELLFHPGQYVDVIGPAGVRRSYSLANAPRDDRLIDLHIREVPGGEMSRYWFERATVGDLLRIYGPLGTFFLRDVAEKDLVFLATGTGIAPVKAMLEGLDKYDARPASITVYWGARETSDFYWHPVHLSLEHRFIPVLSRPSSEWTGARGYVQHALIDTPPSWERTVVYACGSEAMIHSAGEVLVKAGLNDRNFRSDAFVCSAPN
jgi:CDP-4-dehydro-6-deoxyglucose reductase